MHVVSGTACIIGHEVLPCFQDICCFHKVTEVFTYMGAFGAATMKPTRLYSNCQAAVLALKRTIKRADFKKKSQEMHVVKYYKDVVGRKRATGGKGLKATQAYPKQFGIDTAASYH